jgi:putative DNA methylase
MDDRCLIEDYLPIEAISAEASREKSVRKGHISTLHLWWARRPLVACRAAVYGALVPADRWVKEVELKAPSDDAAKAEKIKNGKKKGLNRKAAKEFVTKLCRYPKTNPTKEEDTRIKRETEAAIVEAQRHILEAHADRLTAELADAKKSDNPPAWVEEFKFKGERVTYDDIVAGRAPRPRVLDMFAGGGAIPLEALRLSCEAYALDLNPVAHIIELCTLVYPQKYGKPDPNARGMTGPKNSQGETTWCGLADEVRYWGNWVLDRVRKEIGDLYPPIPDPEVWSTPPEIAFDRENGAWKVIKEGKLKRGVRLEQPTAPARLLPDDSDDEADDEEAHGNSVSDAPALPPGFLQPVAYLWTHTVRCKNPSCAAVVPLVRQTWLRKKKGRHVALKMLAPRGSKSVRFEVVESETENGLGFDPAGFSKAGNATCPFCGTVADNKYVKEEGQAGRLSSQMMAVVCTRPGQKGKVYLSVEQASRLLLEEKPTGETGGTPVLLYPSEEEIRRRIAELCQRTGLTVPDEPCVRTGGNQMAVLHYGMYDFGKLFTPRQMLCLLTFAAAVREAHQLMLRQGGQAGGPSNTSTGEPPRPPTPEDLERAKAVAAYLGVLVNRIADYSSSLARWHITREIIAGTFGRQALPMVWDFCELAPFGGASGSPMGAINWVVAVAEEQNRITRPGTVTRGSATALPWGSGTGGPPVLFDAVITDPPYYDNVSYSNLSDFFYVWLKRTIGHLYPEHFATAGTPKKQEAVADASRHGGDKAKARAAYEQMMAQSLAEAHRVLKPGGTLVVVYAHKTTLGWATLVDAFRRAGFTITEAWPLDTEMKSRLLAMDTAALASSIFPVGRKRAAGSGTGNYEDDVQPELQQIVRERVETLWEMGIAGADLVIACVGAGLRAFTKYERVEYANGEEVPAEKFLAEVEGGVLDTMMGKLFGQAGAKVSAIDPASRFYVLWRFVYKATEIEAGEAIVFTYAQHVELDGPNGLSSGKDALVEKKKSKYRARDYTERGASDRLGLPSDTGQPAPLIDVLHRVLWLMEHGPRKLGEFLMDSGTDRERLRVLAQTLAGPALSGKSAEDAAQLVSTTAAEQAALGKLLANWRSVVDDAAFTPAEQADRKRGQARMFK